MLLKETTSSLFQSQFFDISSENITLLLQVFRRVFELSNDLLKEFLFGFFKHELSRVLIMMISSTTIIWEDFHKLLAMLRWCTWNWFRALNLRSHYCSIWRFAISNWDCCKLRSLCSKRREILRILRVLLVIKCWWLVLRRNDGSLYILLNSNHWPAMIH